MLSPSHIRWQPSQLSIFQRITALRLSPPPSPDATDAPSGAAPVPSTADPLTVQESDLERRCLGTLTDALRAVISYAHSSYRVAISFQVKRFDRAHGQVWVKVCPDEVPEGFDLKYLLQHVKFYENMPRYAELLCTDDYKLRSTCQFFLDLQSRAASPTNTDDSGCGAASSDLGRAKETILRTTRWVEEMISVGLSDRDVVRQLSLAQRKLRDINLAMDKFSSFHQNQSEALRASSTWFPDRQKQAARSIHQQMSSVLDDPEVVKYILHVVGPRLGLVPFNFQHHPY